MRRIFYIPALILLYLLTTAKSCDNRESDGEARDQASLAAARDSISSAFSSDTLTDAALRAFETTAKIRLSDFGDYLAILHDDSVAGAFREKAREMIRGLFVSENSVLHLSLPGNQEPQDVSLKRLLASGDNGTVSFGKIMDDSIRVKQRLQRSDDSTYRGILSYSFFPAEQRDEKSPKPALANGTINFTLTKHEKHFGTDTLMIWEVFLGNAE